jgi:hypothetical protein
MTREALEKDEDIQEIAARSGLTPGRLAEILDPANMTGATGTPPRI